MNTKLLVLLFSLISISVSVNEKKNYSDEVEEEKERLENPEGTLISIKK